MNFYLAYGIIIRSEISLNSLLKYDGEESEDFISVRLGKVPDSLLKPASVEKPFTIFNERELLYHLPDRLKMYVANGNEVIIEPLNQNIEEVLLYFYSNGLAAALYQRNLIPFHVSGVCLNESEVVLVAAPSRTGKSTMAVKLQERGFPIFTDDTAVLIVENSQIFARASYPMTRLWEDSIEEQHIFKDGEKIQVYCQAESDKYGFHFHDNFASGKYKVKGLVFLEISGIGVELEPLSKSRTVKLLGQNIYRGQWVDGMKMGDEQFRLLLNIANAVPSFLASRPAGEKSFDGFTDLIVNEVCQKVNK
ncbi:hypothetical protein [uncultured Arcticibacterium sp.]|uniref:hypothetical protein n=1 Tax=uncultured Arcticibacterium sp. TaxID=2173042 RepID=UPI0030FC1D42